MADEGAPVDLREQLLRLLATDPELARDAAALLATLPTVSPSNAAVLGGGAVAQGEGAEALGAGAVKLENLHVTISAATTPAESVAALQRAYLNHVVSRYGDLELSSIDPASVAPAGNKRPGLESVYTSLFTMVDPRSVFASDGLRPEHSRRRPSALELLDHSPRLALLGGPGSGKTMFARFVALCMAGELLPLKRANLTVLRAPMLDLDGKPEAQPQLWRHGPLLPVVIVLRDFASRALPEPGRPATMQHVWSYLDLYLEEEGLTDYAPHLRNHLLERGGIVLFDGLDEVPEAETRRAQIVQAVEAFAGACDRCRILLTCRTYAYQQQDWRVRDFQEATLSPFTPQQIETFVHLWYEDAARRGTVAPAAVAGQRAEALAEAVMANDRLSEMAERPLLLTLMASLHAWRGGDLPDRRHALYEEAVELLLFKWEKHRTSHLGTARDGGANEGLFSWLQIDREKVRSVLEKLAFEAHERQPSDAETAEVRESDLLFELNAIRRRPSDNPSELVDHLRDRSGILISNGVGRYTFPHRSFQEYLAACHLSGGTYPNRVADLTRAKPDRWREVAQLAGARASSGTPGPIWELVEALCLRKSGEPDNTPEDLWGAQVAAQALIETRHLVDVAPQHAAKLDRLRRWLVHIVEHSSLPAYERALAGRALAKLGDPREYVTSLDAMEFCFVPMCRFMMGSSKADGFAEQSERPLHWCELPYDFWMARFPVTVGQWREYVEATQPEIDAESLEGDTNAPVGFVDWFQAQAFCRWLTRRWRKMSVLPAALKVCLPSEAEWEKAARGGELKLSEPQRCPISMLGSPRSRVTFPNRIAARLFPWGNDWDADCANYVSTRIGRLSAIGCFPRGASPYGCEEMSGNVLEWTRSMWGKEFKMPQFIYPYRADDGRESVADPTLLRVLRGSSSWDAPRDMRCAYRNRGGPGLRDGSIGFRVVLSPSSFEP